MHDPNTTEPADDNNKRGADGKSSHKRDRSFEPGSDVDGPSRQNKRSRGSDKPADKATFTVEEYTVGWICALPTEFNAAQAFLDEEHEGCPPVSQHDNNNYALGKIGSHNVVIAVLPDGEYGNNVAAAVARDMLHSFPNVRIGLMVGIGGGAPSSKHDVRLGDVVVSSREGGKGGVFQYDFGKAVQNQDISFQHTDFLNQPPTVLRAAVSALKSRYKRKGHQLNADINEALERWPRLRKEYSRPPSDSDRLYRSDVLHPDLSDECNRVCSNDSAYLVHRINRGEYDDDPVIHFGLIASANQLMKNAAIRDKLAAEKDVLCFEMEAAGLMNHFPCLVIRGICDYSDSHKNEEWQGFAAMTAAAYAADLLHQIPVNKVEAEKRISDALGLLQVDLGRVHHDVNETKVTAAAIRNDQHLKDLRRWLSPPDHSSNATMARARRHAGTGTWLLESDAFHEWKTGKRQHLWLYGLVGCGKTILSATIIEHLEQTNAHPTLAFFFDFNDTRKQTLENLLCSLAFQLYHTGGEAASILDNLFTSHDNGRRHLGVSALSAYVASMLRSSQRITVVLDALDECTTRAELLSWMKSLASCSTVGNTQFIVTGRPEADFQHELPRAFGQDNCVLIDKKAVNADICSYVTAELHQRPEFVDKGLPLDLLEQIRSRLGDGADGMFRWATCQLESLARCLHPQAIQEALEHLPLDLNETYKRMLQEIPPELKSDAIRLLQFLVHAEQPLTLPAAIDVIAMQTGSKQHGSDIKRRRLFREDDILKYCPSLISITKVFRFNGVVREIHLVHFSVKEYLLCETQFQPATASVTIAKTCLTYLVNIPGGIRDIESNFPLSQHATKVWMEHARLAETSDDIVQRSVLFLQDKTRLIIWAQLYETVTIRDRAIGPSLASGFYYACQGGLLRVSRILMDKRVDVNAQGGRYGNALQAASYRGHNNIVQMLLNNGADVNAQGGHYGNALYAASEGGHNNIVQMLLGNGADVNAQGGDYSNALQAASFRGYSNIVQMLLNNGADVNAQGGRYGNALQAASFNGHSNIIQMLLNNSADVNAQGGDCRNALQAASEGGYSNIVQMLLNNGADVNAQGGHYGNALQAASVGGYNNIVQMLLNNSTDVNAQGGRYGNALQAASVGGHDNIIQMLLNNGADVNAQGGYYGNALQATSYRGYNNIVQMLLNNGADVNAQGGHYGNALYAASYRGYNNIVQMLLNNSADVNAQGGRYGNALQAASEGGHSNIIQMLLNNGADVNVQGGYYDNALQAASYRGHSNIIRMLLNNGADVNAQGGHYGNALQAASVGGHSNIAQMLLNNSADVNAQGGDYSNALQAASFRGYSNIVQMLLNNGADVNAQGGYYDNALQTASYRGYSNIVQMLLDNSADVNAQGGDCSNALQAASEGGHSNIVQMLLNNGADVNAQGSRYGNALQAASYRGYNYIVQMLLDNGADVNAQGGYFGNALQAASKGGHSNIVQMLLDNGADLGHNGISGA